MRLSWLICCQFNHFLNLFEKNVDKMSIIIYNNKRIVRKVDASILQFNIYAFLAQLDRALVYGTKGQGFESLRTHHIAWMAPSFFMS